MDFLFRRKFLIGGAPERVTSKQFEIAKCRMMPTNLFHMHLLTQYFDTEICTKQAYFPKWKSSDPNDISILKCSVRVDENMSGCFFSSTYEKRLEI